MKKLLKKLSDVNILPLNTIRKIETPSEYFKELKHGLIIANEVYISSMYFGEDVKTNELIKIIQNRNLEGRRTIIILDKSRGMTEHIKIMIQKYDLFDNFYFKKKHPCFLNRKICEILSVFHSKIMMFDDNVIITGANVNGEYFTTRLDRYYLVNNRDLVNLTIGTLFVPIIQGSTNCDGFNVVDGELGSIHTSIYGKLKDESNFSNLDLYGDSVSDFIVEQTDPVSFINAFNRSEVTTDPKIIVYDERSEYDIIKALVNRGFDEIYVSTAYLNLPYSYIKLLRDCNVKLIVNDPESNIFKEYGRFGDTITNIYSYSTLRTALNMKNAEIYEFKREGFTMHSKGIWAFRESLAATIIGSSNFNRRSSERDDELNFLILSVDSEHIKLLKSEVNALLCYSKLTPVHELQSRDYSLLIILFFIIFNKYI